MLGIIHIDLFITLITLFSFLVSSDPLSAPNYSALKLLDVAVSLLKEKQMSKINRPLVTIAYAQTMDGSIAPSKRRRLQISSKLSFQLLHSLRRHHQAVCFIVVIILFICF